MPKNWLYFIALVLPLAFSAILLYTPFLEWLWYQGHEDSYRMFSALSVQPRFLELMGGWPLPVFVITIFSYWLSEDSDAIPDQFLMLPVIYVPFTVVGDALVTREIHMQNLYVHPLLIIPAAYFYVFTWVIFIKVMAKLRLVV